MSSNDRDPLAVTDRHGGRSLELSEKNAQRELDPALESKAGTAGASSGGISHDLLWTVAKLRTVADRIRQLRKLFEDCCALSEPCGPPQPQVEMGLQALQDALLPLTERYPAMSRPPVSQALSDLRLSVMDVQKKSETKRYSEILRDFDNLELSLVCTTVEETLMDPDTQSITETISTEHIDLDDMTSEDVDGIENPHDVEEKDGSPSHQEADLALCRSEGVWSSPCSTQQWCRYAKDLLAWIDKRISLEQEFAKNIMKAAETARSCVAQQDMMPLQYIYTMALEHDIQSSTTTKHTGDMVHQRCYQALAAKKNEIDKWRREFKDQWAREQKKMNDAVATLKKARQQYLQRSEELEKVRAMSAKAGEDLGTKTLDRRRKSRDDAQSKMIDAEMLYRHYVGEARMQQDDLQKVKEKIISHIRKLICQGDTVLKEATVNMFYFQRQQTESLPLGYHSLELTCRPCEPGEPYLLYISSQRRHDQPLQTFTFQEFVPQSKRSPSSGRRKTGHLPTSERAGYSDSESIGGSLESLTSPAHGNRKLPKAPSTGTMSSDDLDEREMGTVYEAESVEALLSEGNGAAGRARMPSRAALTHRLKKMKSKMAKCKQCDNYILVNGIECEECGLAVHRKCLEMCQLVCEHRKGILFGVGFSLLPRQQPWEVPEIVERCTAEIENRALAVQGIYRVSGSKPRVLKLCQAFEIQKDQVDLSDLSPHDITSVLKHFFKELPEPLLTFDRYNDFIAVGKDIQRLSERQNVGETSGIVEKIVHSLRALLGSLPPYSYSTLHHMIVHLHRVSQHYEENKMSSGNLGIVFGPTLLRPLVSGDVSMIALLETSYQALLLEFLISHHEEIFGPQRRPCTPPPPTAPLPDTPPRASCPPAQQTSAPRELGASSRERPRSLETRTIKRDSSEGYISDKSSSNEAVDQLSPEASERTVLVVRSAAAAPPGQAVGEPDPHLGTRGHFSRQPVKYQRQPTLALHLRAACAGDGEPPGSADSSRSSSPEPGAQSQARCRPAVAPETTRPLGQAGHAPEGQTCPRESGRAAGVCDAATESAAAMSNPKSNHAQGPESRAKVDALAKLNRNQSNNRLGSGVGPVLSRSLRRAPGEERTAHKILSGLKLRRSDSGKGEQLHFV